MTTTTTRSTSHTAPLQPPTATYSRNISTFVTVLLFGQTLPAKLVRDDTHLPDPILSKRGGSNTFATSLGLAISIVTVSLCVILLSICYCYSGKKYGNRTSTQGSSRRTVKQPRAANNGHPNYAAHHSQEESSSGYMTAGSSELSQPVQARPEEVHMTKYQHDEHIYEESPSEEDQLGEEDIGDQRLWGDGLGEDQQMRDQQMRDQQIRDQERQEQERRAQERRDQETRYQEGPIREEEQYLHQHVPGQFAPYTHVLEQITEDRTTDHLPDGNQHVTDPMDAPQRAENGIPEGSDEVSSNMTGQNLFSDTEEHVNSHNKSEKIRDKWRHASQKSKNLRGEIFWNTTLDILAVIRLRSVCPCKSDNINRIRNEAK